MTPKEPTLVTALALFLVAIPHEMRAAPDESLERGKKIYGKECAPCHGVRGRGDGPEAKRLGFRPRDLTLGAFKCRCAPTGDLPTDDDLLRTVSRGMPGTPMKAFENTLSLEDRRAVVRYLKTLSPRFASVPAAECVPLPQFSPSVPRGPTPGSIRDGEQIYRLLKCWTCHGKTGRGDGPAAPGLKDDWGARIRAYDFTQPDKFKCGDEDEDLYRLLHTGMNGSPMPSFGDALVFAREGVQDLSALKGLYTPAEMKETADFVAHQPPSSTIEGMSRQEKSALVEGRTWALVHFLRTLLPR